METLAMLGTALVGSSTAVAGATATGASLAPIVTSGLLGTGGAMTAGATLGTLATIGSVGGTVASSLSQLNAGKSEQAASEYNASVLMRESEQKREAAKADTLQLSRQKNEMLGAQTAAYGSAGVSLEGSPLAVMAETAKNYERDIMMRGYAGDVGAESQVNQAAMQEWVGKQKKKAAYWGAGTNLLTGLGGYAVSRMGYGRRGMYF